MGSACCFGGRREKWYPLPGNLPTLNLHLHKECPGHQGLLGYEVTENADGTLTYATEEEAEYPCKLCQCYAVALRQQLDRDQLFFETMVMAERERHYKEELALTLTG